MDHELLARHSIYVILATSLLCAGVDDSQSLPASNLPQEIREYVICADPVVVLSHVKVIDGTGKPPRPDQTLIIRDGKIVAVGDTSSTPAPAGARVLNLAGHTVIPRLVGMHEHLFYTSALDPDATDKLVPHLSDASVFLCFAHKKDQRTYETCKNGLIRN